MQSCDTSPRNNSALHHNDENAWLLKMDDEAPADPNEHQVQSHQDVACNDHIIQCEQQKKIFAVLCISLTLFFAAISYFILWNIIIDNLRYDPHAKLTVIVWIGFSAVCPLLCGIVADAKMGRFISIFGAALLHILGIACVSISAREHNSVKVLSQEVSDTFFYVGLFLIELGKGGILVNITAFGADQINDGETDSVRKYCLRFQWIICFGILLTSIAFCLVMQSQPNCHWVICIISGISMFLSVAIFILGRNNYTSYPPIGSFLLDACKIIWHALRCLVCRRMARGAQPESWFDRSKRTFGGPFLDMQVEDVKLVIKILPIFLCTIVFWPINFQIYVAFAKQSFFMNLKGVPIYLVLLFYPLTISVLVPVIDKLALPLLTRCGVEVTPLKRIGAGMVFCALSLALAGVVEMQRNKPLYGTFQQELLYGTTVNASTMSVFFQVPQHVFYGFANILVFATGLEFAYMESPRYVHGVIIGIFYATIGFSYLLARLVPVLDASKAHGSEEYYFFSLFCLIIVNLMVFTAVSLKYRYLSAPFIVLRSQERGFFSGYRSI